MSVSSGIENKFEELARYCLDLARQADTPERRDRLLKMACEYMQAAQDARKLVRISVDMDDVRGG
jgi:hypothetical protein